MRKKVFIPILAGIYLISLAAGFIFAGYQRAIAVTPEPALKHQATWVLIRVDDMTIENPRLVSVWAMFLTFSPDPQIYFKPIYSADTSKPAADDLGSLFSVSADRSISGDFIAGLDRLQIHRTGLVILDETGFQAFTSWFLKLAGNVETQPVATKKSVVSQGNASLEAHAYTNICKVLASQEASQLSPLPWDRLVPTHILPHPSLDSLSQLWDQIITSGIPAHCEVIPSF